MMHKYFLFGVVFISVFNSNAMEKPTQQYFDEIILSSQASVTKSIMGDLGQSVYILENDNGITDSIKEFDIKSKELYVLENHELARGSSFKSLVKPVLKDFICHQEFIMVGTETGTIRLWNAYARKFIAELTDQERHVRALAMIKNTNKLCSIRDIGIKVWDIEKCVGERILSCNCWNSASRGCVSKNGVLYVADENKVIAFDERSENFRKVVAGNCITAIADDENNVHRIFVSIGEKIHEFDVRKIEPLWTLKNERMISALRVFDNKLYVGRSSSSSFAKKELYPDIKAFDLTKNYACILALPGKNIVNHLEINKLGVFVSSEKGLTLFPSQLYKDKYLIS